ncbi:MAG: hypothetical protein ACYDBB_16430 [Armatimonadota bacterium]
METPQAIVPKRRTRRIWMIAVLIILVLLAWGWLRLPRRLQLVGRYTALNEDVSSSRCVLATSDAGFLLRDEDGAFCLRDWRKGKVRWRQMPASADWGTSLPDWSSASRRSFNEQSTYALSRNGRFFATAVHQQKRLYVQIWCDGTLTGNTLLPADFCTGASETDYPLIISDRGRLFIMAYASQRGRSFSSPNAHHDILVLENGRILARGSFPFDLSNLDADQAIALSFVNNSVNGYTVAIRQGQLSFTHRFHTAHYVQLLDDGTLIDGTGRVYSATGKGTTANEWDLYGSTNSTHRAWVMQLKIKAFAERRVFHPATGDAWTFTNPDTAKAIAYLRQTPPPIIGRSYFQRSDVSSDGRYALDVTEVPQPFPPHLIPYYQRFPWLQRLSPQGPGISYRIYECPGKLCAGLIMRAAPEYATQGYYGTPDSSFHAYLSPDGHSVLIGPGFDQKKLFFALYRW